jgi:endoglucanase
MWAWKWRLGVLSALLAACDVGESGARDEYEGCGSRALMLGPAYAHLAPGDVALRLGPGVNFGNMFDAPQEGAWNVRYDPTYLDAVKNAGFEHIRLPVRFSNHASLDAAAELDEAFVCRIDGVIDHAIQVGLSVVMDVHHYRQIDGDTLDPGEALVDPNVVDQRLVNIWRQLGARYQQRSNRLVFELYNEPHNRLTPDKWNALAPQLLAAVRETNPDRAVMVGGTSWYNADGLATFELPVDPNLLLTVHDYDPFQFTFQGSYIDGSAAWLGTTCCDADQQHTIDASLDIAANFGAAHGVPVYLGEFGSSEAADEASRVTYTRHLRTAAEARDMPWAIWSLLNNAIYDARAHAFHADLLDALLGP